MVCVLFQGVKRLTLGGMEVHNLSLPPARFFRRWTGVYNGLSLLLHSGRGGGFPVSFPEYPNPLLLGNDIRKRGNIGKKFALGRIVGEGSIEVSR